LWKARSQGGISSSYPKVNPDERAAGVHCLATAKASMTNWRKPRELVETLLYLSRSLINASHVRIRCNIFHIGHSRRRFGDLMIGQCAMCIIAKMMENVS
jgi:hypothetical protein